MHRISIGTWAYTVGPYANHPVPFEDVVRTLKDLRFDGLELGSFDPHPSWKTHPTKEDRQRLLDFVSSNGLAFSGIAADLWREKLLNTEDDARQYLETFRKCLDFADDLGIKIFRVDTVQPPEILNSMDKDLARTRLVKTWKQVAKETADRGMDVAWEFEPGFAFNRPSDIVRILDEVDEPNFGVQFDTCHAYMVGVVGAKQTGGPTETLKGGIVEFARMLRGRINSIHVIDSDGSLHDDHTSTHAPIGEGRIDFPPILTELSRNSGIKHDWWTIDLCFWPDAWPVTERCKMALDALNRQVG
jgi:sugar phosphate isomerase/epimerase